MVGVGVEGGFHGMIEARGVGGGGRVLVWGYYSRVGQNRGVEDGVRRLAGNYSRMATGILRECRL